MILIASFLCVDLILAWQVSRLRGFTNPGALAAALVPSAVPGEAPKTLPALEVHTTGWQESWLGLLHNPTCIPQTPEAREASPSVQCTSAQDGAHLDWYDGLLQFTTDHPVYTQREAESEARQIIDQVDPHLLSDLPSGVWDPTSQATTVVAGQRYQDLPLFNGEWVIHAGAHGVNATRWWIVVDQPVAKSSKPLILPNQANGLARQLYGPAAVTAPGQTELGYYNPHPRPVEQTVGHTSPGAASTVNQVDSAPSYTTAPDWSLDPVYRVHLNEDECVYVDAWSDQLVDGKVHSDC